MKLLSFDIEISDIFELAQYEDMEKYAPFHISVAATAIQNGEERLWYSTDGEGYPTFNLTQQKAHELLEYLDEMQQMGIMICAWNGLSFDLRWIGHHAEDMPFAAQIAMKSYDPMFQFFNQTGFPISLAKAAEGMGIPQEKLMDGSDAPIQWQAGNHRAVMDYCLGDCQMTNLVIEAIQKARQVQWRTVAGHLSSRPMPQLKTVEEVINLSGPDQSWMDTPIPKSKFYKWIEEI